MRKVVRFRTPIQGQGEPDRRKVKIRAKEAQGVSDFDTYYFPLGPKECLADKKAEKQRNSILHPIAKTRGKRNRFAVRDEKRNAGQREERKRLFSRDIFDLIKGNEGRSEAPSSRQTAGKTSSKEKRPKEHSLTIPRSNGERLLLKQKRRNTSQIAKKGAQCRTQVHAQQSLKAYFEKKMQRVVHEQDGASRRTTAEPLPKRLGPSPLRIVPVAEMRNLQTPTTQLNCAPVIAEPSIEYNLFYLLARFGDNISPLDTANTDISNIARRKLTCWSCTEAWFLCSVQKDGFPWRLRTMQDARGILNSTTMTKHLSDYIVRQKLLDLTMAHDLHGFLNKEYRAYMHCKIRTLQFVGYFAMKKHIQGLKSLHTPERRTYQYLKWENNSCALDAFISVLPYICLSLVSKGMSSSKIAGSNACLHSPAACIFAALEVVQSEKMDLTLASNWTRHLFIDIIMYLSPQRDLHRQQAHWSCFKRPQPFLDVSSLLFLLPDLLGRSSPSFQELNIPPVLEVSMHDVKTTFETSRHSFESLGAFLFASIMGSLQNGTSLERESIYIFGFTFPEASSSFQNFKHWMQELLLTSWNYNSEPNESSLLLSREIESSTQEKKWRFETLGLIGQSSRTANHFVSLSCSPTCQTSVWFYDGLEDNGRAKYISKMEAMSLANPLIKSEGLFLISSLSQLEQE